MRPAFCARRAAAPKAIEDILAQHAHDPFRRVAESARAPDCVDVSAIAAGMVW
jgi:hypothetical protein